MAPVRAGVRATRTLRVGGFTPFSNLDFPGRLAAIVFVQGCPWRCRYCHNPHLQPRGPEAEERGLAWVDVLARIRRRQGLLDAVVFSGGEPTLDPCLPLAMADVRAMGFAVGLHTAGIYPRRLASVLPLVDWVGFDIKAPPGDAEVHDQVVGAAGGGQAASASLDLLLGSGVACEFRTTAHPALMPDAVLVRIAEQLAARGAKVFALQIARPVENLPRPLESVGLDYPLDTTVKRLCTLFPRFILRRE